jgi:hypothetical protein
MDKSKILPFAMHPKIRSQIEKEDAKKPAGEKVIQPKPKLDTKTSSLKNIRAQIIEDKPKKKEVREYYRKMVEELSNASDSD